ncbi:hypothetical protein [Methanoregula sp.]|uniref:hypothetical protein n=1 Tax=Methanoregula sp. TaxID=2052170 RepID=UPI000CC3FEBC|nr:hypothetical protein [Methanoregula sp.]PKG33580.1 MAG: hypothetical protein CW742_02195 [Methanoregula sp.]
MSVPYLNRGESIILTTHRVSAGSVLYDAMLTNQRLILMDSHYERLEPEMIPFSDIVTVKGGKAATMEPALILTLKEPNDFSDSAQVSLIFTQNPGEKRRHERELWVKRLIELVIRARELEAQSPAVPVTRKNGLQPTVRRWEAPEPVRPRSSIAEPAAPIAEPVIITEQETDSLEFFLEEKNRKNETVEPAPKTPDDTLPPFPVRAPETPSTATEYRAGEPLAGDLSSQEPLPEPETIPVQESVPRDPFAGIRIPLPQADKAETPQPPAEQPERAGEYQSPEQFGTIVQAAAESLKAVRNKPVFPPVEEPVVKKTSPLPGPTQKTARDSPPARQTAGEKRELPGTYTPDAAIPAMPSPPKKRVPQPGRTSKSAGKNPAPVRKPSVVAALLAVIAVIIILAVAAVTVNSLYGSPYSNTVITITPSAGSNPPPEQVQADMQPAGVYVRIIYAGDFSGSVGNPGLLRQVSGRGNQTFPVLMTKSIVQATIRKLDPSPEPLTVGIYSNSTLLAERTVNAPQGEVSLLIDTTTAVAPGMGTKTTPADGRTLLGNGSLIYY